MNLVDDIVDAPKKKAVLKDTSRADLRTTLISLAMKLTNKFNLPKPFEDFIH